MMTASLPATATAARLKPSFREALAPTSACIVGMNARQDRRGGFVEQRAQANHLGMTKRTFPQPVIMHIDEFRQSFDQVRSVSTSSLSKLARASKIAANSRCCRLTVALTSLSAASLCPLASRRYFEIMSIMRKLSD
jgi:hypothetical protein